MRLFLFFDKSFQLRPPGTECRAREGECDLAEYCTGEGEYCPENVFIHDGRSCSGGLVRDPFYDNIL